MSFFKIFFSFRRNQLYRILHTAKNIDKNNDKKDNIIPVILINYKISNYYNIIKYFLWEKKQRKYKPLSYTGFKKMEIESLTFQKRCFLRGQ